MAEQSYKIISTENDSNVRFVVTVDFTEDGKVIDTRIYGMPNTHTDEDIAAEVERNAAVYFDDLNRARAEQAGASSTHQPN